MIPTILSFRTATIALVPLQSPSHVDKLQRRMTGHPTLSVSFETGMCQESRSKSSDSPPIGIRGGNSGQSVPTGVSVTVYKDQGLGMRWCPAGVGRWLVVPIAKKAQAQLMCWPTNYRRLVGQRVRRAAERNGRSRGSGDEGLT